MSPRRAAPRTVSLAAGLCALALVPACSRPAAPRVAAAPLPKAPVASLARAASLDASGSAAGAALPNRVLLRYGGRVAGGPPSLSWRTASGASSVSPRTWLAYRSAAGRVFWLAGDGGPVALTGGAEDAAGKGERALLVDARRADRVLATYDLR